MDRQRIVVVEDDRETLEMMGSLLLMEGYHPILCAEREDAYEIVRRTQPDLVILDLMMGDPEAGWTILLMLREDPMTADIPVIMYSADTHFLRVREEALRMQHCTILEKPFHIHELQLSIAEVLGPHSVA